MLPVWIVLAESPGSARASETPVLVFTKLVEYIKVCMYIQMSFCYFESNCSIFYSLFLSPHQPLWFYFCTSGTRFYVDLKCVVLRLVALFLSDVPVLEASLF